LAPVGNGAGEAQRVGRDGGKVTPVPLPLTWRILATLRCPSCGKDWNFYPEQNGRFERDAYCPNVDCEQYGHIYTVLLALDGVQIKAVKK
jgi:hypothetical protein